VNGSEATTDAGRSHDNDNIADEVHIIQQHFIHIIQHFIHIMAGVELC